MADDQNGIPTQVAVQPPITPEILEEYEAHKRRQLGIVEPVAQTQVRDGEVSEEDAPKTVSTKAVGRAPSNKSV